MKSQSKSSQIFLQWHIHKSLSLNAPKVLEKFVKN